MDWVDGKDRFLITIARTRYHQMISTLVNQIVMDRRGVGDDFSSVYGVSVGNLIQKFSDIERLQTEAEQLAGARETIEELQREKHDLEQEVSRLKAANAATPYNGTYPALLICSS